MYKWLLAWRYLRTRFIAIASIVSVTLGVATLIVVNSVMSGFVDEMYDRLHGIYADIDLSSPGLGEIHGADQRQQQIESILGVDLEASTGVVQVPALLQFEFRGRPMTQQIMLLGIDDQSYGRVAEFHQFLKNDHLRKKLDFQLQDDGYDPSLGEAGWSYRRARVRFERELRGEPSGPPIAAPLSDDRPPAPAGALEPKLIPLPETPPDLESLAAHPMREDGLVPGVSDPYAAMRQQIHPEEEFDPLRDQYTGIILGLAISNRKFKDPQTGENLEAYLLRPGDDVQLTLPTAGPAPSPITQNCTVVDFYHSNMHEYDANFAFMPLSKLQKIRGMIDPSTGLRSVSAIQMKLRPGADLNQARDKLTAFFPPTQYPFIVQTWLDAQRPLLSAVMMELTILNILLFMIIAVAGFGILATFYMIVVEKTKDIGILKALGASRQGVMSIFLAYGCSLGIVGAGVGIGLGLLFVANINQIADGIQLITGREVFDPTMYYFSEIPTLVSPWCIAWVATGAVAIAVLASVLPALRAARLHPVEALRYE
jgi:lipoprotein-releasing system permease protein